VYSVVRNCFIVRIVVFAAVHHHVLLQIISIILNDDDDDDDNDNHDNDEEVSMTISSKTNIMSLQEKNTKISKVIAC